MCGVIALILADATAQVAQHLIDGLTVLQHRGQDAAGITTSSMGKMNIIKDVGLVKEVFTQENVVNLVGNVGIGHVRYPTSGT